MTDLEKTFLQNSYGGWVVRTIAVNAELKYPDYEIEHFPKEAFDRVMGGYKQAFKEMDEAGAGYRPLAYCGSLLVTSGINHMFIVAQTTATQPIINRVAKVVLHQRLPEDIFSIVMMETLIM